MRKINDLTGCTAGKWTILERVSTPGAHDIQYKCKCQCGTVRVKKACVLIKRNGEVVGTGCSKCTHGGRVGTGKYKGWEREKHIWGNML